MSSKQVSPVLKAKGLGIFAVIAWIAGASPVHAERYEAPDVFRLDSEYRIPSRSLRPDQPAEKTPAEYWRATGLTIQNYFDDIIDQCYDNIRAFRGCYEGLSALAGVARPGGAMLGTLDEQAAGHPALGQVVEDLPYGLKLFEFKKIDVRDRLQLRDLQVKMRSVHAKATERLFSARPRIDFSALMNVMKGRALAGANSNNEAWYAAALYNEFLSATDDPHSRLSPTEEELVSFAGNEQRFYGVGIQTREEKGKIFVYRVYRGSPAERYGLRRNDQIVEIDGKSVAGQRDAQVVSMIRGADGTPVTFKVRRATKEVTVVVTRGAVVVKNIDSWMVADTGMPLGYIRYGDFMDERGALKLRQAIAALEGQGARGLILDLRGNGGGLLSQAFEVSEFFVGKKDILSVMELTLGRWRTFTGEQDPITRLPLAVLIDSDSASASEIAAGAIQDHGRGWIVGDRSFGKGTVQGIARYPFKSYAGNRNYARVDDPRAPIRYRKTMQRFYQPSGRTNQIQGIIPNFQIDPFPNATAADRFEFREEDYYENALPAIEQPWVETRTAQVARISTCRDSAKQDAWYRGMSTSDVGLDPPDYRLYAAQDILRCQNQTERLAAE